MKIGILGTKTVGRAHAVKLTGLGHDIAIGTRNVDKTAAHTEKDPMDGLTYSAWNAAHKEIKLMTFADAAAYGEIVYSALKGEAALEVLTSLKVQLKGKILIDVTNPLDYTKGMSPSLFVCNTDSLGEQIQRALPDTKVVKTFNTMGAVLQTDPKKLAGGDHEIFVSGNDDGAKAQVIEIQKSYGWKNIIDLGDITTARGTEMLLPIWLLLWSKFENPMFNYRIVR